MSPQENRTNWVESAMKKNQGTCEGFDPERAAQRLSEHLKRQFSGIASEPLPADMLALLEKLNHVAK